MAVFSIAKGLDSYLKKLKVGVWILSAMSLLYVIVALERIAD